MEFSSSYDLDLPAPVARILSERIEQHMQETAKHVSFRPKVADFVVPGVLHLSNVLYFQSIEYSVPFEEPRFKPEPREDKLDQFYAPKFDVNENRIQVRFTVWQQIVNL